MEETIGDRVANLLEQLRSRLQTDGGDIEFLGLENGVVRVKLKGACAGCPMSAMTLKMEVERYLKESVPEIVRVDSV